MERNGRSTFGRVAESIGRPNMARPFPLPTGGSLRARFDVPVPLHTPDTAGGSLATYLAAVEAGVDAVDGAAAPSGASAPTGAILSEVTDQQRLSPSYFS